MAKTYVEMETLEEALRENGCYFLLEELDTVSAQDVVKDMSVLDLQTALESTDEVFATQVWKREDVRAAMRVKNIELDELFVSEVIAEATAALENCTDNWDRLHSAIEEVQKRRAAK